MPTVVGHTKSVPFQSRLDGVAWGKCLHRDAVRQAVQSGWERNVSGIPSVVKTGTSSCMVATFNGDMDSSTGPLFRTEFLNLINAADGIVILDLAGVPFCNSLGLNALVAAWRRAREIGITLGLARVRPQLRQLLELSGVDEIFSLYGSVAEAKAALCH